MELPEAFVSALHRDFPADFLSQAPDDRQTYGTDWTKVLPPNPAAVVFPRQTSEVSRFLRLCSDHGVPVVPSGGRTGLAGGAVAARGEVVLSMDRMRRMDPVDTLARTVRVEAGAITKAVHQHCAAVGLSWPVDFASAGSSQIGGNIATNAGGVRVVRYGLTRQWVLGLQVVTVSGDILELNGALEKNNTGLDLRQLFIGTEGTLGVITEATLKLTRLPQHTRVALLGVESLQRALSLFESARSQSGFQLLAFEYFTHSCMEVVLSQHQLAAPFEAPLPCYVLMEMELPDNNVAAADQWLEQRFEDESVLDGVLAQSSKESASLWAFREAISESLSRKGFLHKNDIAVPVRSLDAFVHDMQQAFAERYPDYEIHLFGHVGDGNLHINIMKPPSMDKEAFLATCHDTDAALFEIVQRHGGSISAEHGIGLLKRDFLHYSRTAAELATFKHIKQALDPKALLNPGKIFTI